jgi:hypothetical protein
MLPRSQHYHLNVFSLSLLCVLQVLTRTAVASSVTCTIFTGLEDHTLLAQITIPLSGVALLPEIEPSVHMLGALILGIMSGILGLLGFMLLGVFGKIGDTVFERIDSLGEKLGLKEEVLGHLLTPAIGGRQRLADASDWRSDCWLAVQGGSTATG